MAASGVKTLPTIGFLTVVENEQWGITGGLLILNVAGRPLEFHCTAPLKPNRAQEILYGPTLRPFLYGEQIGQTLLSKTKSETLFICTDVEAAMGAREAISLPLVLLCERAGSESTVATRTPTTFRVDAGHRASGPHASLAEFSLGRHTVAVLAQFGSDRDQVIESWKPHQDHLDLVEPFGRIREALDEAQRGAAK
jgi:hypothetical protein